MQRPSEYRASPCPQARAMAVALELVSVCTNWAQAKEILQADPGQGPWNVFSLEDTEKRWSAGHACVGMAASVFLSLLKQWAMDGQEVHLIEATSCAQKHRAALKCYAFVDTPGATLRSPARDPQFE